VYELKGVPQPPKKGRGARKRRLKRAGPRYVRKLAGLAHGGSVSRPRSRGRSGRGRVSGGSSLIAKLFRKMIAKAGLQRPTLRSLFRKKSVGDGRNHGFQGIRKRNGRTGLAGR